jgi:4-hydroxybenzoate polyprenyltransferase
VAVSAVSVLLGAGVGLEGGTLAVFGLAVLTGQLSIGWSNDALDAARDVDAGRTDKPAAVGDVTPRQLWWAAGAAATTTVVLSVLLGAGAVILLLPAAGWAYNLGLKGTWWSGAAYAVGFAALPAGPWLSLPNAQGPPWWAPVAGALLGLGAHVANVLPDLEEDRAAGIRGLPHRLGPRRSLVLMAAALVTAVLVTGFGPADASTGVAVAGTAVAVVVAAGAVWLSWKRPGNRASFPAVLALALLVTVQFGLAT